MIGPIGLALLLASGCRGLEEPPLSDACDGRPVRMAVAASLRQIASELVLRIQAASPTIAIEPVFGASSAHARQLALGAPLDLVVSADARIIEDLARDGLVVPESLREVASNGLALVARPGAFASTTGVAVLGDPELRRIAIPSAAVPLGHYARAWLEGRDGLGPLDGRIVATEHAVATMSAVEAGHVDLAIVYRSDAQAARGARVLARIDPDEHPRIRYVAARASRAPACAAIDVVLDAWTDETTQRRFAELGFGPPAASASEIAHPAPTPAARAAADGV